ncbi:MAG: YqaA family protein [Candidatus Paceibacterota bacterium]
MIQKLVDWVEKWAGHHHANTALSIVSFIESSFFPIPPFVLIVGMLSLDKKPSWVRLAIIGTISSVLGGIFGYFVGKFFYGYIGAPLISWYGLESEVAYLGNIFREHVFITILLASLSPAPYKVFTLSAGLFSVNLWMFIFASIIGRSIRFFVVSYFADRYGVRAKKFIVEQQKITGRILLGAVVVCIIYFMLKMQGIL